MTTNELKQRSRCIADANEKDLSDDKICAEIDAHYYYLQDMIRCAGGRGISSAAKMDKVNAILDADGCVDVGGYANISGVEILIGDCWRSPVKTSVSARLSGQDPCSCCCPDSIADPSQEGCCVCCKEYAYIHTGTTVQIFPTPEVGTQICVTTQDCHVLDWSDPTDQPRLPKYMCEALAIHAGNSYRSRHQLPLDEWSIKTYNEYMNKFKEGLEEEGDDASGQIVTGCFDMGCFE